MNAEADLLAAGWKARSTGAAAAGFMQHAGPLLSRREPEGWAYALLVDDRHLNPAGVVHGGALVTLVDHALSLIAWEAVERQSCLTLQLDTQFIGPVVTGSLVEARGRVVRRTAGLVFMRGGLTVAGREVVAAQAILKIVRA